MLVGWLIAILVIGLICGILIGDVVYGILYMGMIGLALCYLPIVTPLSLINLHRVKTAYGKPLLYGEIIEVASGYHRQTLFLSKNPIPCKQAYQDSEGNNVARDAEYVCYAERLGGGTCLYCRYKATAVAGKDLVYIISWEDPRQLSQGELERREEEQRAITEPKMWYNSEFWKDAWFRRFCVIIVILFGFFTILVIVLKYLFVP